MKNKLSFLRSMKFGMILLVIILILCFAGSMIVQGRTGEEYIARYGETGAMLINLLDLNDVFKSPFFIIIALALCANLTDCSITRFKSVRNASSTFVKRCENAELKYPTDKEKKERLVSLLERKHYKKETSGRRTIYFKDRAGFWGSFYVHVGLLLLIAAGTAALAGAKVQDINVYPGTSAYLDDGTEVYVESFHMTDEEGKTDYVSNINVTLPEGKKSGNTDIRVNSPLRIGKYKIYQQSYYAGGSMGITNDATGDVSTMQLDSSSFFSLDGKTGYYFVEMYFGYEKDEAGGIKAIDDSQPVDYTKAVYFGYSVTEEGMTPVILFPGEEISIGGITCRAGDSGMCTGLRIKALSQVVLGIMYVVFVFFIAALWLCFFKVPIGVAVEDEGFALMSSKAQTGLMLELEAEEIIDATK